ncbi:Nicotinamide riboside kinase [Spathaspora sp. JA1]|nr:Nicotinamide riboside kinase [Spathaspora sp. JA1]
MTIPDDKEVILIACGGPSSSGKTTVSKALKYLIPDSVLIHLDDFYFHDSEIPIDSKTGLQNWDCPEALDFDRFVKCLYDIKYNHILPKIDSLEPDANLKLSKLEERIFQKMINQSSDKFSNKIIVMVDGFMLFHNPEIFNLFDIKLFFHANYETLKQRRESRSGYQTLDSVWVDPPHYFDNIVWPAYEQSHKYLFEQNDIGNPLKQDVIEKYNIVDINNDNGTRLFTLIELALNSILRNI